MKKVALVVAGGKGLRINHNIPKQFLLLNGVPILMRTLEKFSHLDKIILVLPKTQIEYWGRLCDKYNFSTYHIIVKGGATRFNSVKNGLEKIDNNSVVAIHDGVRPLVSVKLIDLLIDKVKSGVGIIPVLPMKDSVRKIKGGKSTSVNRETLFNVQTPQCFLSFDIKKAYAQKYSEKFTDDACVFENNRGNIKTVLGENKNLKITTEEDLKIVSALYH